MTKMPLVVVFMDSLADFIQEVPPPATVRLSLVERNVCANMPACEVQVRVQGRPSRGDELIVLLWTHKFMTEQEPVDTHEWATYRQIRTHILELLRTYLTSQGYKVRGGTYGLPQDIEPVCGILEVLDWQQEKPGADYILRLRQEVTA